MLSCIHFKWYNWSKITHTRYILRIFRQLLDSTKHSCGLLLLHSAIRSDHHLQIWSVPSHWFVLPAQLYVMGGHHGGWTAENQNLRVSIKDLDLNFLAASKPTTLSIWTLSYLKLQIKPLETAKLLYTIMYRFPAYHQWIHRYCW